MPSDSYSVDCLICGADLVYAPQRRMLACVLCAGEYAAEASCRNGHYVCDRCHGLPAVELIERTCAESQETDPLKLADSLMRHAAVKMHGPEHHFLVPAVLVAASCTVSGDEDRVEKLTVARQRAGDLKGGFCGTHGACGAAVGAGIACSVLTGATPLSRDAWSLANQLTAVCLMAIAEIGGPRCCKRDTWLALQVSRAFLNDHLQTNLPAGRAPACSFAADNRECLQSACPFFPHLV